MSLGFISQHEFKVLLTKILKLHFFFQRLTTMANAICSALDEEYLKQPSEMKSRGKAHPI